MENEHKIMNNYTITSRDVPKEKHSTLRGEHTGT